MELALLVIVGAAITTGIATRLDNDDPVKAPEVKLTVARLLICEGEGNELMAARKTTVTDAPGAKVPIGIPFTGEAVVAGVPFTVTLPGTKATPLGSGSVTTTLVTFAMPLFVAVIVN